MPIELIEWRATDYLQTQESQVAYIAAAIEDGDPALIEAALDDVARIRGHDIGGGDQSPSSSRESFRLHEKSTLALLALHGSTTDALRQRGIVRTGNAPLGDYTEVAFSKAFNWTLATSSSSGFDATDDNGVRYQIKSRRITARNPSRQLSAIRRLPEKSFDYLACALFNNEFQLQRAALIPHAIVVERAKHGIHTNSWRFMFVNGVWDTAGTRDVTDELAVAIANL